MFYYAPHHCEKPHGCSVKWINDLIHLLYLVSYGVFRGGNNRLRGIMTSGLAVLATNPQQLSGTFLKLAGRLLNCSF